MNLKIDIQQATVSADSFGQPIETWTDVVGLTGLWSSAITTGGREYYAAQKLNTETMIVFKLRYVPGITTLMRVKYNSKYYGILNINNVNEGGNFILLSCREVG